MTFQKNILTRAILATGLVAGLGLSQMALAVPASDDLQITAGLVEALTLKCETALSFGITQLGLLVRSANTLLTLDPNGGTITVTGDTEGVSAGTGVAGVCVISGSTAADNATVSVQFNDPDPLALDGSAFNNLDAPGTFLSGLGTTSAFSTFPSTVQIQNNGATFNIGGQLNIPKEAISANMGGYSKSITVTVNDGV